MSDNDDFNLFPKASRNGDPDTSHKAEREINAEGIRGVMMVRALSAVHKWPGRTSNELEQLAGGKNGSIRKRLNDLWRRDMIRKGDERKDETSGRLAETWLPIT